MSDRSTLKLLGGLALLIFVGASAVIPTAEGQQTTKNFLVLARQAASEGYEGRAKDLVDQAARVARTAQDWYDVASEYQALGWEGKAREANERAEMALKKPPPRR